ncbi:hypothetical protein QBC47DRAFT_407332 [Echria macrotheca]|uniref:Uncharacterized protein n=1 Tax=Echria macrotheca TaxID=438768 RepID=A0AAJ0F6F8_9PEZI|nr:hypothetical protein QBC47DRAFT_407332 [Echria macrotheca]
MPGFAGPIVAEALAVSAFTTPAPTATISFAQPVAHYVYTYVVGSAATLTTAWPEPASCATAIPTLVAGTCNTASCTTFAPSVLSDILYTYGLDVNFPDFTTNQQLTSTDCMPPGYAHIKSMYFTGGTQCPSSWTTATVDQNSISSSKTIVCCPTNYAATSISGAAVYDCYQNLTLTAQQSLILVAEGRIPTARPATVPSDVGWVSGWTSRSLIATTAWPTATIASLYHPAVNFLVTGASAIPSASNTGSASSSSTSSADTFSLFKLGMGASIGVLIAIGVAGLIGLCCLYGIIRRFACGPRKVPVQQTPQPPPYYPPPTMQYAQPQYGPDGQPMQYPPQAYQQPQVQYGYGK